MKIGILTFHRAHNYGAVLQCYALQEVLKGMGHDVEVIDYRQRFIERVYEVCSLGLIRRKITHPLSLLDYVRKEIPQRMLLRRNFSQFRENFLNISHPCSRDNICIDYDAYIIGSDQLWGVNCLGGKLDTVYFGDFPHNKNAKIIGYAISTNERSLTSLGRSELVKLLGNFTKLSLRENLMSEKLFEISNVRSSVTLDPTLLLNKCKWNFSSLEEWDKKDYILVYYVKRGYGEYAHEEIVKKAQKLACKIGCEVVDLSSMQYPVMDFVMSFKYAKCVLTSSFHASVFSVIFNTPLCSFKLHDGCDGRYVNLLNSLGMKKCIIELDDNIMDIPHIDYSVVNDKLNDLINPSLVFLKESLL